MIYVLLGIVAVIDLAVLAKLIYAFRLLAFPKIEDSHASELPSVSVCIAARNETHAMTQCLERVVASDYPKLEVIVLDDGSRDDTSMLIKSFAYSGVRFIEGKPLPEGWLGKNYAQSILANEASGELVFFLDVDTLIDIHTVSRTVQYMKQHQAKMVSIIPIRNETWQTSTLFATMRHFWTLMRFHPTRPKAVANAWIVDRETLVAQFETDKSLPLSMQVESTIAAHLANSKKYRLLLSNQRLGLRYEKRWSSQVETGIRLLYPQCDRKWYQVAGLSATLLLALTPYVAAFFTPWALVLVVLQFAIAYYYLSHTWVRFRWYGALLLPFTIAQEIILLIMSAYKYNFGTITWKGRPITTAMRGAK